MKKEYRLKFEVTCEHCEGEKKVKSSPLSEELWTCSNCDGTGFQEDYIYFDMQVFKDLFGGK